MLKSNFAIFILTHGRADNLDTVRTLKKTNYSGKIYLILDNEDKTVDRYKELYSDQVEDIIIFDKKEVAKRVDDMSTSKVLNAVVYARNITWDIARDLKLDYFLVLDDDYIAFTYRIPNEDRSSLLGIGIYNFDEMINQMVEFLENSNALTISMSQGGELIGGLNSQVYKNRLARKAMNTFFCKTDRPFKFIGKINEDVNAYVKEGIRGNLFFTISDLSVVQRETQQNKGGLTDIYLASGTYVKSFYTVMISPSSVTVRDMGMASRRLHHRID